MKVYFDTSALIKRYIHEPGSDNVDAIFNDTDEIYVSNITQLEAFSTFRRLKTEKAINEDEYIFLINEFKQDYQYFEKIIFDETVSSISRVIIDAYQLKTLDSIQLGSALCFKNSISLFAACDKKLLRAAREENIHIVDPTE